MEYRSDDWWYFHDRGKDPSPRVTLASLAVMKMYLLRFLSKCDSITFFFASNKFSLADVSSLALTVNYIEASAATVAGQTMQNQPDCWGEASSIPPHPEQRSSRIWLRQQAKMA